MNENEIDRPFNILLIEDNPLDIAYTKAILEESKFPNKPYTISNGKEAMTFIKRLENNENALIPHIILLDLKLPYKTGLNCSR